MPITERGAEAQKMEGKFPLIVEPGIRFVVSRFVSNSFPRLRPRLPPFLLAVSMPKEPHAKVAKAAKKKAAGGVRGPDLHSLFGGFVFRMNRSTTFASLADFA
jgi:hypothetical protein